MPPGSDSGFDSSCLVVSESKLSDEVSVGDHRTGILPRGDGSLDVRLIPERADGAIVELRGDNNGTTTRPTRSDLDRLALSYGDLVALVATKLRQGHGTQSPSVRLVQVVHKFTALEVGLLGYTLNLKSTTSPSCIT